MAAISRHLRQRLRLNSMTVNKRYHPKSDASKHRFYSSESDKEKDMGKKQIPNLSARRSNRISVAQRLTSMLPTDYLDTNLDAESRKEVEILRGASSATEKSSFSASSVPKTEQSQQSNSILWQDTTCVPEDVHDASTLIDSSRDLGRAFRPGCLITAVLLPSEDEGIASKRHLRLQSGSQLVLSPELAEDFVRKGMEYVSHDSLIGRQPGDVIKLKDESPSLLLRQMTLEDYLRWTLNEMTTWQENKFSGQKLEDSLAVHPRLMAAIAHLLEIEAGHHVLEVGTGFGSSSLKISQLVGSYGKLNTVDRNSGALEVARRTIDGWRRRRGNGEGDNAIDKGNVRILDADASCGTSFSMAGLDLDSHDAIFLDVANPELVVDKVIPYLKLGSCLGFVTRNLSVIVKFKEILLRQKIPLLVETVLTSEEIAWEVTVNSIRSLDGFSMSPFSPLPIFVVKARRVSDFEFARRCETEGIVE